MGSGNFIVFLFEVASGPLLSLLYPLFFTIQAAEGGAAADHGPLLKYWCVYSGLALIEYFFEFIIDWLPWDILLAVINVFLIVPHFNGATFVYQQVKAKLIEAKTNPSGLLADAPPFLNNLLNDQLGIMAALGKFFNSAVQSLTSAFSGPSTQSNAFRSMPPRPNTHYSYQNPQMDNYDAHENELRSRSQVSQLDDSAERSELADDGRTSGRLKTVPGRWRRWPDSRSRP
ncbi:hypothetical protein MKW94_026236 [Papaver nudicaule]|uniref:HVA22-like protein n=1 Tax=Papaver nudicaule TaxID=74823 RepID=A0AA41VBM8_PAPNU|nr:hypothetical protein [Papaver nudicaule]